MDLLISLVILFTVFSVCLSTATTCPVGWLAYKNSCYLFGTLSTRFSIAESFCRQNGGDLVEIDDIYESNFLKEHLRQMKDNNWWLGLTDEFVEGEWKLYHSGKAVNFTDWANGEPGPGNRLEAEDCAFMTYTADFAWADGECQTSSCSPICERPGLSCQDAVYVG